MLRMLNRLIEPTSGRILINGEDAADRDPVDLRRRIGYVIQNVGLFPHQTIASNIGTVPHLLGWPRKKIAARTDELMDLVGLDPARYGPRYPHELSGGQRQRVGVARALAADPVVLLMDEPFSAVDPIVRVRLQDEFLRLQRTVRKTIVFVTHDIDEAVRMADKVAVLSEGGVLQQYAEPADLLRDPDNDFVTEFVGADRGIKRLSVTPIDVERLAPVASIGAELDGGPSVAADATLRDAFAALLVAGRGWVAVRDSHGKPLGILTATDVAESIANTPGSEAAAGASNPPG